MLSGCSVRQPLPKLQECPTIDVALPDRVKPLKAMEEGKPFPSIAKNMELLTEEEQAKDVVRIIVLGAELYNTCELNRKTLIDWINEK